MNVAQEIKVASEDRLRADLYNFLGLMLSGPPDQLLINQCVGLSGDDGELGKAIGSLSRVARVSKPKKVESEFNALFVGLGRGELLPYASYYLTGFLNEKPLATLRTDMSARGMVRSPNVFRAGRQYCLIDGNDGWDDRRDASYGAGRFERPKTFLQPAYRALGRAFLFRP